MTTSFARSDCRSPKWFQIAPKLRRPLHQPSLSTAPIALSPARTIVVTS
jgi:hypothetical protein